MKSLEEHLAHTDQGPAREFTISVIPVSALSPPASARHWPLPPHPAHPSPTYQPTTCSLAVCPLLSGKPKSSSLQGPELFMTSDTKSSGTSMATNPYLLFRGSLFTRRIQTEALNIEQTKMDPLKRQDKNGGFAQDPS